MTAGSGGRHRIRLQAAWRPPMADNAWTRSFGRPAGLQAADRVWLVIERPTVRGVALNGRPLSCSPSGAAAWRHDITGQLRDRNELVIDSDAVVAVAGAGRVALPAAAGLVSLEIEPAG